MSDSTLIRLSRRRVTVTLAGFGALMLVGLALVVFSPESFPVRFRGGALWAFGGLFAIIASATLVLLARIAASGFAFATVSPSGRVSLPRRLGHPDYWLVARRRRRSRSIDWDHATFSADNQSHGTTEFRIADSRSVLVGVVLTSWVEPDYYSRWEEHKGRFSRGGTPLDGGR